MFMPIEGRSHVYEVGIFFTEVPIPGELIS